jgi:uncharacterized protein (DUF488 family)
VEIYTIGFTRKSAEEFFGVLNEHGIQQLLDIRLNNTSQLAAFAKRDDLAFFLRELCDVDYRHEPLLAPTQELLTGYRKNTITWEEYEEIFNQLMVERQIARSLDRGIFERKTVLLCSEATADECHRRLVAEFLQDNWGDVQIVHL